MSNDQHDLDDWSTDSASLFREARRAHDPTMEDRAAIDAVFARLRANGHVPPSAAERVPETALRGATRVWLSQIVKGSLALLLVAAASFGVMQAIRQPSAQTSSERLVSPAAAGAESSIVTSPTPTPSVEPSDDRPTPTPVARRQDEPRARSQPRRLRANPGKQRTSATGKVSAVEVSSVAQGDSADGAAASAADATQRDRSAVVTEANPSAPIPDAAPRAKSPEPNVHEPSAPPRKTDPLPPDSLAELALVKRIHAELRESDFSTVLGLCAEHAQRWPHGTFELEREGVRAIASCGASSEGAAQLASQFLTAHPHAPVAMRVRSACAAQLPKK